ncbi:MAG: FAD-binding oxidoreductase, partial [Vampirovibrionales bacterium]
LELCPEQRYALVEPGVVNADLTTVCKPYGLFFAPDPSSLAACTLGGNVAENAGGIHCLKYGVTTDHLLGMEVILPTGECVWLERPEGYDALGGGADIDLTGLWCGSEGTLGVITKLKLALTPLPTHVGVMLLGFETTLHATQCIAAIMASRILPAAMEFMDALTVQAVNQAFHMGFPETLEALLLVELDAHDESHFLMQYQALTEVVKPFAPPLYRWETTPEACEGLWKARKGTVAAYGRFRPAMVVQDTVIPLETLPEVLAGIQAICEQYEVLVGNVFHAGDGNLHPNILLNPQDPDETQRVLQANEAIIALCLKMGGVLSGEHGIGLEKIAFMNDAFSSEVLACFESLKRAFDPALRCNPGKMLPSIAKRCGESGCYHINGGSLQHSQGGIRLKGFPLSPYRATSETIPFLWI